MANFNYRRFFVILRRKDTGFELHEKEPSGYCKIDIKNNRIKFFIYVQDLKPQAAEQGTYEAYIVSLREEKPVLKLADIFVDNRGRAECTAESDIETLKCTAKSLEEFSAIAIVCKSLMHKGKLRYPLVGTAGKRAEIDWSGRIMDDILKTSGIDIKKEITLKQEDVAIDETASAKTASNETIELDVAAKSDEAISIEKEIPHDENLILSDDLCSLSDTGLNEDKEILGNAASQTVLSNESDDVSPELGAKNEEPQIEEIIVEKIQTHDKITSEDDVNSEDETDVSKCLPFSSTNYWDVMRDYFMKISRENPRVYPFGYNDDRKWVKVEHIPDGYSKYSNQKAYMDFHTADPQKRDQESLTHYLVGFIDHYEDVSYVIYGFPGYSYEQPPAYAIHGLSVWEPIKNGFGRGYWLIYIDALTGDLVKRP